KPFEGEVLSVIAQVQSVEPPAPTSLRAEIPLELARICQTAMHKNPAQRYPSAAEMAQALQHWLDAAKARASSLLRPNPQPRSQAHHRLWLTRSLRLDRGWDWCRKNRQLAGGTALATLALFTFVGLISRHNQRPSAPINSELPASGTLPDESDSQSA